MTHTQTLMMLMLSPSIYLVLITFGAEVGSFCVTERRGHKTSESSYAGRSSFDGSISVMTKSESTSSGRSSDGAGVYGRRQETSNCLPFN